MSRPIYSVIADPESLRWQTYHRDLRAFWKARNVEPDLHVVSWLDVIASSGNLDATLGQVSVLDDPSHYVRIESPARGMEMMRAMLAAGRRLESGSPQFHMDPTSKSFAKGELVAPGQFFRGFQFVLNGMETWLRTNRFAGQLSACPLSIAEMFDKNATSERLESESIPVPDRLAFEGDLNRSAIEIGRELLGEIRRSCMQKVYVKLAHGSSASGMIYLDLTGAKTKNLSTMVLLDGAFFNTRKIQSLEGDHLLGALGFLVQNGVCVQREVRKAFIGGESFDLRVIVVNGRVEFTIFRLSESPFTNLHLGGRRGDWASCRAAIPQRAWLDAMDNCVRASELYSTDRVGVDLAFERDFRGHSILELNPFGDFFPDWKNERGQTVHSRIIQSNAEKMGWVRTHLISKDPPIMNDNVKRIHELIGKLCDAKWARVEVDPGRWPEIIYEESPPDMPPTTSEEIDAWSQLTAPDNQLDFAEYQKYWADTCLNDFAKRLHKKIEIEIERRLREE